MYVRACALILPSPSEKETTSNALIPTALAFVFGGGLTCLLSCETLSKKPLRGSTARGRKGNEDGLINFVPELVVEKMNGDLKMPAILSATSTCIHHPH